MGFTPSLRLRLSLRPQPWFGMNLGTSLKQLNLRAFWGEFWMESCIETWAGSRTRVSLRDHTHLSPNMSVLLVSGALKEEGEQQMTRVVRALPPRLSCSTRVSLLSR